MAHASLLGNRQVEGQHRPSHSIRTATCRAAIFAAVSFSLATIDGGSAPNFCLCAKQAFLPVSRQQAKSPLGAQAAGLCSAYAAERKARFLPGSGLALCSIRRRISAHLCSSSAIWRESSAAPIAEIGVVRRNSASHVSKATLLLGIIHFFVFTGLELTNPVFSVRRATSKLNDHGCFVYLLLI